MDIESYLKGNLPFIDREIEKIIPKKIDQKWLKRVFGKTRYEYDAGTLTNAISVPVWDLLARGGKRWRPSLVILAYEAFGGKNEKLKRFVALPELVHNGTLMVDDIEDDSELRRGKPCTHKLFGEDIAINAGNTMYFLPFILLFNNELNLSDKLRAKIYDLYAIEMLTVSCGQALDIYWHKGKKSEIKESQYLQMCAFKTGTLARLSAKLGAILAGAKKQEEEKIGRFAESIGVAFQIQDDILNLVGEEFQKGKGVGEDIHEGKRTLIVLRTLQKAKEEDRKRLIEILDLHAREQKTIDEAIEIIKKYDGIDYAKEKSRELVRKSWKEVAPVLKETKAKKLLKEFGDYLINRKI